MSAMNYTLHKTTSEDETKVEEFLHVNFFPHMPIIVIFGVQNRPPTRSRSSESTADKDFTIKAVDAERQLIGVAINRVNSHFNVDSDTPPEVIKMVEFFHFTEENAQLSKLPENTIELRVLSVRQDWKQRGVARRLAEESMRLARAAGFTTMKVCCTSEFTAKLARSLGWREHYRLAYKDYPRLSGKDVALQPCPPHEYFYYYITDL